MPPTRRTTRTATRADGSQLYSDSTPDPVTVEPAPGVTKTYPDATEQWAAFMLENGGRVRLRSSWEFMRNAMMAFIRDPRMTSVEGWTHLDDLPVAYLVRAHPKPGTGRRQVAYEIIGAVRLDEIISPADVAEIHPDVAEGEDDQI